MDKGERKCREALSKIRKKLKEKYGAKKISKIEDEYFEGGFYQASYDMSIGDGTFTVYAGYSGETGISCQIGIPTHDRPIDADSIISSYTPIVWNKFLKGIVRGNNTSKNFTTEQVEKLMIHFAHQ